ncbi:MAG: transketolase [Candidatus Eisenbacteria sp.]|nr:transketolase [Candidatus Eisenbacteria bacterium]
MLTTQETDFGHWETVKDLVDQLIDLMLNLRQSGHPGGSHSKVYLLVALLLSGAFRWDIRDPGRRFADRFILSAGHTVPLVYATLAVLAEAMRIRYVYTKRKKYEVPPGNAVFCEDLPGFRRMGGLPGHAEMSGKTHFLKFNTGPSGHGLPAAAGQALALKQAGLASVGVFALEGEGGLTPGATQEMKNSAWGLGLTNLHVLLDWNDFGIDPHRISRVVPGTPRDWFEPHGWIVEEVPDGEDWQALAQALLRITTGPAEAPSLLFARMRKGRSYLKYDAASHGAPHTPMNSDLFWETKRPFAERYGVRFEGFGEPAPEGEEACIAQTRLNIERVISVLHDDRDLCNYLADRLLGLAEAVPERIEGFRFNGSGTGPPAAGPCEDESLFDPATYPDDLWAPPGTVIANKDALGRWGGWINDTCRKRYGRPLFLACSADLAQSTSIAGFAGSWGWFDRQENPEGVLLPQEITEFTNASLMIGVACTNLAPNPAQRFDGFYGACSTYGAFSYLKYGPMRLFSQLAQDSDFKVGKVLWVAGHSGPETADDSRTHFGIFAPGVTQLFPRGSIVEIHPWEYNEVPVMLAAAMKHPAPIVALHLTRPPIRVPDRKTIGMPSHLEASRGAYVIRPYRPDESPCGTVLVQGSSTTAGLLEVLPELDRRGLNVKIVAVLSPQLFASQDASYRDAVLPEVDRWDAMGVTNRSLRLLTEWFATDVAAEYSLSSDWDHRWRTGGTVNEVLEEAHLTPEWILRGIVRFAEDRPRRLERMRSTLAALANGPRGRPRC